MPAGVGLSGSGTICYRAAGIFVAAGGRVSMHRPAKIFAFRMPAAISRLAVVIGVAGLVAGAVVHSRDTNTASRASPQAFVQPRDRLQADGGFTPAAAVADLPEPKDLDMAAAVPLPRPRPSTPGYYYELMRAQGDGEEGEYVLVARQCRPGIDMPEPCYFPERERRDFPLRRE